MGRLVVLQRRPVEGRTARSNGGLRGGHGAFPRPSRDAVLVDRGAYRRVRHPIYAGLVLLALGWSLARGSAVGLGLVVVLAVFLDLKARREEALLTAAFPGYGQYRDRTRRFIPGLY